MTVIFLIALMDSQYHHLLTISMTQLFVSSVCVCVCYLHCGDVLSREGIGSVADEQACFTHSPEIRKETF